MLRKLRIIVWLGVVISIMTGATPMLGVATASFAAEPPRVQKVVVPEADRFTPFAVTIHVGDSIEWINKDTDDHTVVSDDFFNTAGNNGTNQPLPGTDSNGGEPGTFHLRFTHAGTFVYYCRLHSHLDEFHQPVAPGPNGGIQGDNGNFGTPMMGIITVLPSKSNE